MKIKLNVRINITTEGKVFTVWPRPNRYLHGIKFYTGISESLGEAIHKLKESLPDVFPIDDEYSVCSKSLEFTVIRPFDIVRSQNIRTFITTSDNRASVLEINPINRYSDSE